MVMLFVVPGTIQARDRTIKVTELDTRIKPNPLPPGGPSASVVTSRRAGKGELQILVASKIPLHIHDQDHVVFVERETGTARIENATARLKRARESPATSSTCTPPKFSE